MPETLAGKFGTAALIAAGLGFGLIEGLRAFTQDSEGSAARIPALEAELVTLRIALSHLSGRVDGVESRVSDCISHQELSAALDQAVGGIDSRIQAGFEVQGRSVETLRLMVIQTDTLLERVLEGLESMKEEPWPEQVSR